MSETLLAVGGSGNSGSSPAKAISRIFDLLVTRAGPIWLLLPFALMAIALMLSERRLTLYQLALVVQLPLLVVVFSDPGLRLQSPGRLRGRDDPRRRRALGSRRRPGTAIDRAPEPRSPWRSCSEQPMRTASR